MIKIKVEVQGKIIALGKNVTTISDIQAQINQRYPSKFPDGITVFHQQQIISDLVAYIAQYPHKQKSYIKFLVKPKQKPILKQADSFQENSLTIEDHNDVKIKNSKTSNDQISAYPSQIKSEGFSRIQALNKTIIEENNQEQFSFDGDLNDSDEEYENLDQVIEGPSKFMKKKKADEIDYDSIPNKYAIDVQEGRITNSTHIEQVETPDSKQKKPDQKTEQKKRESEENVEICCFCEGNGQISKITKDRMMKNANLMKMIEQIVDERLEQKMAVWEKSIMFKMGSLLKKHKKQEEKVQDDEEIVEKQFEIGVESLEVFRKSKIIKQQEIKDDMDEQQKLSDPLAFISKQYEKSEDDISLDLRKEDSMYSDYSMVRQDGEWVKYKKGKIKDSLRETFLQKQNLQHLKNRLSEVNEVNSSLIVLKSLDDLSIQSHPSNLDTVKINTDFSMKFVLKTSYRPKDVLSIWVVDKVSGQTKQINFVPNSEFEVGPYNIKMQGKFKRTFELYYYDNEFEMQFFGNEFGFEVQVIKELKQIVKVNAFKLMLEKFKKKYSVKKSVEQLQKILEEMSIDEQNYEEICVQEIISNVQNDK